MNPHNSEPCGNSNSTLNEEKLLEFNKLMESTYQLAKRLLPFMAKKRIPLTPFNYRLFYDYLAGDNVELKLKLDEVLIASATNFLTQETSEGLYHYFYDYVGDKVKTLTQMGDKLNEVSQDLGANLEKTIDSTGHYRQVLNETAQQINQGDLEAASLRNILDSLLQETKFALNSQSDLADHIDSTNKIIATLTSELRDQTRLANIDELTQLYNRRYMTYSYNQFLSDNPKDPVLSLALFDLDHFKIVNDTHGHSIGDKVLILCAKILQGHADSRIQLPCRYGGEEFLVLYPKLPLKEAAAYAEIVRKQVEETKILVRGQAVPITISCGVALYREGEEFLSFVERADQALYHAKSTGRNKVVTEEELEPPRG
jgi:diguanylate cyclase